jgi:hypothetical protein
MNLPLKHIQTCFELLTATRSNDHPSFHGVKLQSLLVVHDHFLSMKPYAPYVVTIYDRLLNLWNRLVASNGPRLLDSALRITLTLRVRS